MSQPGKEDYLRVGLILRPHGVRGEVKVLPLADDMGRFDELKDAYLEFWGKYESVHVTNANVQGGDVFLTIDGYGDRSAAERLRNVYICVDRAHARKLPDGEYFIVDLIGCNVKDTDGNDLGKLIDVLFTGANDVYVIQGKRRLLLPALKKVLKEVDVIRKEITLYGDVLSEVGLFED